MKKWNLKICPTDLETQYCRISTVFQPHDVLSCIFQVKQIEKEAQELCMVYPDAEKHVNDKVSVLMETLNTLFNKWNTQKQAMEDGQLINELRGDFSEWMGWITTTISAITCNDLATTYNDGVYLSEKHNAINKRIVAKDPSFQDTMLKLDNALITCPRKSNEVSSFISNLKHRRKVSVI